ncbi:MAG: Na+/Ca+ antiporter, CaCA family [Thermoanaerobacterales bacterium 50_218]|nr:MAG: Na+/Ca+ antiporter, CaCA family [Thermoanaerobacterales bacterium 50_218]HAA88982.1 conjugal transfer protein TraR [Peptococcaceae bacterium]
MSATPLLVWAIVFGISLFVLIKASDIFTDAAEKTGVFFGLPGYITGITIVGLGTSLPELASSVLAAVANSTEIVVGNVVGSNIANILLILGATALVRQNLRIHWSQSNLDLFFLLGSAVFVSLTAANGKFASIEGLFCIAGLFSYMSLLVRKTRGNSNDKKEKKEKINWKIPLALVISPVFIYLGARYTVEAVIHFSEILKVGSEVIAASAVALGTSLPELAVSLSAGRKGKAQIAVGNIVGSNIFNSLAVMGVPSLIATLEVPRNIVLLGLPTMVGVTVLYLLMIRNREIGRWEGILLLLLYGIFLRKLFTL